MLLFSGETGDGLCCSMTPLDCAVIGGHHEVAGCLTEYGGVSIATIEDVASTKIQVSLK